jgi:translation initiation factor 2B subunit (eIF-2B alpha/beta/delta family)
MQFTDLTKLIWQLEAEEATDLEIARLAFSPTNRVNLIARTIVRLERLRNSNKRHKVEIDSLQQQLDQAKKAGEDTAAKLKEAMFNQPPQNKQVGYVQD